MIPILGKSEIIGVLGISRTFSDVLIKYKSVTKSDIGILIEKNNKVQATKTSNTTASWQQYNLLSITSHQVNSGLVDYLSANYSIHDFFEESKRIKFKDLDYEVRLIPLHHNTNDENSSYFIFIDNITSDISQLNSDLKRIWLFSVVGMLIALSLILTTLHYFFRRITTLSESLPLLSQKNFNEFRHQIPSIDQGKSISFDEIDKLSQTALVLTDQLESLEQKMRGHTFSLLEKSQELAKERDFVKQLIDLAPIIIIIQKLNGIILSINHAGVEALDALEMGRNKIIGKVFDIYIPESDAEHINKLNRLRKHEYDHPINQDGHIISEHGKTRDISWVHKVLSLKEYENEQVILTLGIDISERKIAEARNVRLAYYDYLTGLGNRRKFHEEFTQQLASAERYKYQLALLYMDLDRFKEINDTSGHEAGDNYLKMVANLLKGTIRSTDLLCRLGGDEFTILMPFADAVGLENIAKKINIVLKNKKFVCAEKEFIPGASIGIAIFPMHGATVNELMANADLAMYRAKELGRGRYHFFDAEYDYRGKSNQMVRWRKILEDALDADKFLLVYQPILDIQSNQISHFECLVRLQLEDDQIILPSEFVFRAEELGLISKIDRLVVTKAIEQHIEFNRRGKDYKLSINISRRSFDDPAIFDDFSGLFANPEIDKNRIIFEITDTSSSSNVQPTNELINRIKDLGCALALNNFGIEYPSLQYLKTTPVEYVKIDGSIIRQIDKNDDDKAFVKALTDVAQTFGKKTVAEYVENENILAILREFGIDYAQGYFIGKPKSLD